MSFQPIIKWSGSKRSQCNEIIKHFPNQIDNYYEPFCGSASILRALLESNIKIENYICSDINKELINLWNDIKFNPEMLIENYKLMWNELYNYKNLEDKKNYFYKIRDRFNKLHSTSDFLFISRTTTNGMIRYNKNGHFNNSFHITRDGIQPDKLEKIMYEWSKILNKNNVQFLCQDYKTIISNENDFLYLDPPYANGKNRYFGTINYNELWNWMKIQKSDYILSFDGISEKDNTYNVPKDLYNEHLYINSGCSSFNRLENNKIIYVKESLYLKIKKVKKDLKEFF